MLLRDEVTPDAPPLSPLGYLGLGVALPELLPTVAALLVLRRRPIGGDCCVGDDGRPCSCWRWRRVGGVDPTPLVSAAAA